MQSSCTNIFTPMIRNRNRFSVFVTHPKSVRALALAVKSEA